MSRSDDDSQRTQYSQVTNSVHKQNQGSEICNNQDRFYSAWADVGELVVLLLTCAAAKMIGRRIEMFAEAGWLPGMGDTRAVAALTNRPESSIASVVGDKPRPKFHVGRQPFFNLRDFAQFDKDADTPATAEKPPNDAPVKRARKNRS